MRSTCHDLTEFDAVKGEAKILHLCEVCAQRYGNQARHEPPED
jgi:hypothetical protein